MGKIAVVMGCNLHWAPFYYKYENYFVNNGISFDLILWNREGIEEKTKGTLLSYNKYDKCNDGNVAKIFKFFSYANFVRKQLVQKDYHRVYFLGTYAGTVALLSRFLKNNYSGRYWIDIRDYSYESVLPYYRMLASAIENSGKCAISSAGYTSFLPQHDYFVMHNIDSHMNEFIAKYQKTESPVIRISYIGNFGASYLPINQELLLALKNDERYQLQYFGFGTDILKDFCQRNGIYNVFFYGRYNSNEAIDFYNQTDIVNNLYGSSRIGVRTALSNKLYFAAALNLPILVCPNTYMDTITSQYHFGYSVDFEKKEWPDTLYDWYIQQGENIDCRELWEKMQVEDMDFPNQMNAFLAY